MICVPPARSRPFRFSPQFGTYDLALVLFELDVTGGGQISAFVAASHAARFQVCYGSGNRVDATVIFYRSGVGQTYRSRGNGQDLIISSAIMRVIRGMVSTALGVGRQGRRMELLMRGPDMRAEKSNRCPIRLAAIAWELPS